MTALNFAPYLDFLRYEKRYAPRTISSYEQDLKKLRVFLLEAKIERWRDVQPLHLRRYITTQHSQGMQASSLQRQLSAIRGLFHYLLQQDPNLSNPVAGLSAPKKGERLPKTVAIEQIERLLDIPLDSTLAVRDKALMELFYSSGLRLAEIAGLDLADMDLNTALVQVLGKGSKQRLLPVGRTAVAALRAWLRVRPELTGKDETPAVFLSVRGTRLSHRAIQQRIDYWARRQGLDQHLHPHRLRHAFATHLLESSGDIRAVQELLGHANISTTQIYTQLDFQHLAAAYDQAHPRAHRHKKVEEQDK